MKGHIVLGISLFRPQGKTGFYFLAKVTGVSGLCDMVWLSFSPHYLGGLSPRAITAGEAATVSPLLTAKPHGRSKTRRAGPSKPIITYFLLPMYPISYPHPIRPISMLPLLLANLHNYSLPFFPRTKSRTWFFSSKRPIILLTLSYTLLSLPSNYCVMLNTYRQREGHTLQ